VRVLQPLRPELEKVMKAQPDVRYFFKEWPIFGSRWEASLQAAQIGLSVWKEKGPQAYVTYHNAVYATGHYEGALTAEDIREAAVKAGVSEPAKNDHTALLEKNSNLAESLGLTGTPGIIVMPSAVPRQTPSRYFRRPLPPGSFRLPSGKPLRHTECAP
jgi:protein-disulfide isomerase